MRLPRPDLPGLATTYSFVIVGLVKPGEAISAEQWHERLSPSITNIQSATNLSEPD